MNISRTCIAIKFQNAIISNQTTISPALSQYYIKITAPSIATQTYGQFLGEDTLIPIPVDGVLKLQLIPSFTYKEKGGYIVKYYKKGNYINHFRQERWVVPFNPALRNEQLVSNSSSRILFSDPVYEIVKVEPNLPYTIEYDSITWTQAIPQPNQKILITYQPGVTLDTLLTLGSTNFSAHSIYNNFLQ